MSPPASTSRTRSTSLRSASRSWCASPSASASALCAASVISEVMALERAGAVANSDGSRFRKTDSTRPCSGWTSISRRRRSRVIALAAINPELPPSRRTGTLWINHAHLGVARGGPVAGEDTQTLHEDEERARERRGLGAPAHVVPVDLLAQRPGDLEQ